MTKCFLQINLFSNNNKKYNVNQTKKYINVSCMNLKYIKLNLLLECIYKRLWNFYNSIILNLNYCHVHIYSG